MGQSWSHAADLVSTKVLPSGVMNDLRGCDWVAMELGSSANTIARPLNQPTLASRILYV